MRQHRGLSWQATGNMATEEDPEREPENFGKGRVCSWPHCATVLSIYNDSDRCRQHDHRKILLRPGSKRRSRS